MFDETSSDANSAGKVGDSTYSHINTFYSVKIKLIMHDNMTVFHGIFRVLHKCIFLVLYFSLNGRMKVDTGLNINLILLIQACSQRFGT